MGTLEEQFHNAMVSIYERAKEECDYNATYFLQMNSEHGGVEAAHSLLRTGDKVQEEFVRLWECGRLDLTVEAHVIKPDFQSLFTPEEHDIAARRLQEYGYSP